MICGSVAYDTILLFPDRFKSHILPDKIHILNVSFLVPEMRREFGGCAANIAYGLKLLGDKGIVMATAGHDFAPYKERMLAQGISVEHIKVIDGTFTAQAFITTDLDDNQITAFHPGAMQHAHLNKVADAGSKVAVGIVAPDGRQAMIEHAAQFAAANIPFIFDPGQGMPMFGDDDLRTFIAQARWVTLNDYEWELLQQKTGLSIPEITAQVEALVVTQGAEGSVIYTKGRKLKDSLRQTSRGGGSHRLRRCLPRWSNSRVAQGLGLGNHRQDGLPHGGHQNRVARAAEPCVHRGRIRAAISGQFRLIL